MGGSINGFFIPWDYSMFARGIDDLIQKIGVGINIGFWIFIVVTGLYLLIGLIQGIGK
ncbi:hypothetical protein EDD70_3002 [Hydrogenoanaerobacterium saccharovorans]|uniref:Uncharacterized protein n=1 Tax=Hydrogenoanaerobacterium saccharovorans TaxID=474960 RepID=A0A1H8EKT4_9FIRM|nr:hypothetical protein [Hydrogenoanaerobacterium saccharovorans]RPF41876.1 hypothetical protein EDD70_3002 [Hydrogenoanaerobacterium saccharovorans]SEN19477.1 hypothetical protein SAMN05216180_3035 [Hydrogenoanaerobacterium saccharovorans]